MRGAGVASAAVALAVLCGPAWAQGDEHMGLSRGLPITIDDAGEIKKGETELKFRSAYERQRDGRHLFLLNPEVEYGVMPGLSVGLTPRYGIGNADEGGRGDVEFEIEYNVLPPSGMRPSLTLVPQVSVPFGPGGESVQSELELRLTQPLGAEKTAPRLHLNVAWRYLHEPDPDERRHRYFAAFGINLPVAAATAVAFDIVREPSRERGTVDNFLEAGVRHALDDKTALGAGVGVGLGPDAPDFRLFVGFQRSF